MSEPPLKPFVCVRTGGRGTWWCLGERKPDGVWTVRCPDCDKPPPSPPDDITMDTDPGCDIF
jgi:hypothetical protein